MHIYIYIYTHILSYSIYYVRNMCILTLCVYTVTLERCPMAPYSVFLESSCPVKLSGIKREPCKIIKAQIADAGGSQCFSA